MKKLTIFTVAISMLSSPVFAGQVFNEQVSGETCEMVDVISDSGNVLYSYRLDPTCGNVRTSKNRVTTVTKVELEVSKDVVKERGVANGVEYSAPNLTSMGNAISNGKPVLRVRTTKETTVRIRRAGGDVVFEGTVGRGDTLIDVDQSGTYIADVEGKSITKATGPQEFDDVDTVTETVTDRVVTTRGGEEDNGG